VIRGGFFRFYTAPRNHYHSFRKHTMLKTTTILACLSIALFCTSAAHADTFGSGLNVFDIDFVTIGNPDNADDTTGDPNPAGKVEYTYRMGQFEISEDMIDKANTLGGLGITKETRGPNKPATNVSWLEAAQFVNWLNTDSGSTPAYKFNGSTFELWTPGDVGYNPNNLYRNNQAKYFLPSVDEWYKAAHYDPSSGNYFDYPTGSDTAPTAVASGIATDTAVYGHAFSQGPADITQAGGLSPYGTMGQGGNVSEWEETDFDLVNDDSVSFARGVRGGGWGDLSFSLQSSVRFNGFSANEFLSGGFRVASIPEPSALLLGALASLGALMLRRRTATP
jgi:hypothetical protein